MAFLCPSRVGKDIKDRKKKVKANAVFGRITGSDSVDTLVRVGLEKQHGLPADCKLLVIKNFEPLSSDELPVKRGQEVYLLYAENEWYYVINAQGREGFIPRTFCTSVKSKSKPSKDRERYRRSSGGSSESNLINDSFESSGTYFSDNSENVSRIDSGILLSDKNNTSYEASDMYPDVRPFRKTLHGQYIALYDFAGIDENDVMVERAELFDVLNIEDPDWSWIRKYDGQEGFVPKSYICPVEPLRIQERISSLENSAAQINFHATPTIRQPLVSHHQLRFQHSTPQPSHKFPLRPSSLEVSKCFSSETNVSDLRKERYALRVHDCSHKERLERNSKSRSRSSSPAASDNTNLRSNARTVTSSIPTSPAVSPSPASADRTRLKVSSTSLNDEQLYSRSSTPSIKSMSKSRIDEQFSLVPFDSISPIQGKDDYKSYDQTLIPQTDNNFETQFCPSSSSSRRPSVSRTPVKEIEAYVHSASERNSNIDSVINGQDDAGFRDIAEKQLEIKEFGTAISASIVHSKPPPYAYAVGRCRKTLNDTSMTYPKYSADQLKNDSPIISEKRDAIDNIRASNSMVSSMMKEDEVDISTNHIQKFQAIRNQIESKLSASMSHSNVGGLSGRKALSQPTSRAVSPTALKEDKHSPDDAEKTMKKAIYSNLSKEEYRKMSNTQTNQDRSPNSISKSEINLMSPSVMTKASSVSNLVSKFNIPTIPMSTEKRSVTFKSSVSLTDNHSKYTTNTSSPRMNSSISMQNDQSEFGKQSHIHYSPMNTYDYIEANMKATRSENYTSSAIFSSGKPTENVADRKESSSSTYAENILPHSNGIQGISELVMLYDYSSKDSGGLVVGRGENVYVDQPDQTDPHWVWVFHPKSKGYGYVPRNYVKSTMLKTTL